MATDPYPWLDENGHRWSENRMPTWQTRWRPRKSWPEGEPDYLAPATIHSRNEGDGDAHRPA